MKRMAGRRHNNKGSAITEFGPALGLLLVCIFFPLLDLLSMAVSYGCCVVLNGAQSHEASLTRKNVAESPAGPIKKTIPDDWANSGIGRFVKMDGNPKTNVTYREGESGDWLVLVDTTVICRPFLTIPVPVVNVPGLNGPMTFTIASERPMEDPDYGK